MFLLRVLTILNPGAKPCQNVNRIKQSSGTRKFAITECRATSGILDGYANQLPSAMKKPPSKADLRKQLERQVDNYIDHGGAVQKISRGTSGRADADGPLKPGLSYGEPRSERTYVTEVVAALEARRRPSKVKPARRPQPQQARKVAVYDEFGEIVRWVWSDA
jgi:hypothetical protein